MKNQKGITLISLVITIVILIILAGVAINMTLGENGIFTKAQEAKKVQAIASAKEQIGLEILEAQIEAMGNNEELEQSEVETIVAKYGALQADGDTIILNDTEYEVSLRDIYNTMAETETDGDTTTELAQLKALLSQTTVTEDKILKDYKAYKDGRIITGTMENYAGTTQDATGTSDDTYTYLSIPSNGYYTTDSRLRTFNSNLNDLQLMSLIKSSSVGGNKTYTFTEDIEHAYLIVSNWNCDPYGETTCSITSGTLTQLSSSDFNSFGNTYNGNSGGGGIKIFELRDVKEGDVITCYNVGLYLTVFLLK